MIGNVLKVAILSLLSFAPSTPIDVDDYWTYFCNFNGGIEYINPGFGYDVPVCFKDYFGGNPSTTLEVEYRWYTSNGSISFTNTQMTNEAIIANMLNNNFYACVAFENVSNAYLVRPFWRITTNSNTDYIYNDSCFFRTYTDSADFSSVNYSIYTTLNGQSTNLWTGGIAEEREFWRFRDLSYQTGWGVIGNYIAGGFEIKVDYSSSNVESYLLLAFGFDNPGSGNFSGYSQGFTDGYNEGQSTGYHNGYIDGQNAGMQISQTSFMSLFASLVDTPIRMLYSLFNFDLFGTSMLIIILSTLTAIVVIKILKKFI